MNKTKIFDSLRSIHDVSKTINSSLDIKRKHPPCGTDNSHCGCFDALTTDRPYRKASDPKIAIKMMAPDAGSHFDPKLLEIFSRRVYRD